MSIIDLDEELELSIKVRAWIAGGYPATRWEPEEPTHIEDMRIWIEDEEISAELFDKIYKKFGHMLESKVYENIRIQEEEMALEHAEHLRELKENR